jgi:lysozyme
MIATFEGFEEHAYRLPGETYYTIGFGHSGPDVHPGQTITHSQALRLLHKDLNRTFVPAVNHLVHRKMRRKFRDALVSFAYNIGTGGFAGSTFLKNINSGKSWCASAKDPNVGLLAWDHDSTGGVSQGLQNRRHAEVHLICDGKYPS